MGKDLTDYMNRQKLNQQFNKLVEDALNDSDVQAFIQAN
ncbi:MAG: primosomal protein DnaI, partial [Latilactobacillus curvatus]|nr:primosomal protein DnaI [Latilactobacillus curvatus]